MIEHNGEIIVFKTTQQARKVADELDIDEVEVETLNSPQETISQRRQSTTQQIEKVVKYLNSINSSMGYFQGLYAWNIHQSKSLFLQK